MKYTKPGITLEKYTLAESIMADTSSMTEPPLEGPPTEENDPGLETASIVGGAFGEVLDFSNK